MSRILTRQRQMAEQGRLRLGYTTAASNGKTRPAASDTWIVTSHSEDHVRAAAELWGGQAERWQPQGHGAEQWRVTTKTTVIDAILPPGDPLSQAYEFWTKGGCQRRCNGVTEELSGSPCICLAEFGERWHEQSSDVVCGNKSRLKVILPDMPGLGVWRMETGSHYAMDEIAGLVDTIRDAVGDRTLVPVRLRIEQRSRTVDGKTKHWVVPVVQVRGATFGELLAGAGASPAAAVEQPAQRAAIEAPASEKPAAATPPSEGSDFAERLRAATAVAEITRVLREAKSAGVDVAPLAEIANQRQQELRNGGGNRRQAATAAPTAPQPESAEQVWERCISAAGPLNLTLSQLEEAYASRHGGKLPATATAEQLAVFLADLEAGRVTAEDKPPF